jgi:hypothetical protein
MGAVIKFAGNLSLIVKEAPAEVEEAVRQAAESGTPLLHFTVQSNNERIAVNPAQICTIH